MEVSTALGSGDRAGPCQISIWEPPHRVVFTWHPDREPGTAQEVELTFEPTADGTKLTLEHRGWEKLGERAAEARSDYDGGWEVVLRQAYGRRCESSSGAETTA